MQFQPIDKLGQRWPCWRCDALSELDQRAWKQPSEEPRWFYDLHPVGRHVLRDNGEVPALLSSYLRAQRKEQRGVFDDVAEVEFTADGEAQAELDLVAYTDDVLTVAEYKSSSRKLVGSNGRAEVRKKCQAAAWLHTDRLVFATTEKEWKSARHTLITKAVRGFKDWGPLGAPIVTLVSGLGTEEVTEQML